VMYWLFEAAVGRQQSTEETTEELSVEAAIQDSQVSPEVRNSGSPEEGQSTGDWRQALNKSWDEQEESTSSKNSPFTIHHSPVPSAIYNLGTGTARSFYDLASATFRGLDLEPNIVFIDMPEDIRDKYQYFTEADMHKLKSAGYTESFFSLEEGVDDYVRNYLAKGMLY
jgi:hypothetical protein